ncbi:MAG: TetR family transcriptional regulator [Micromonospora sp.]
MPDNGPRPLRADALRSWQRLLDAAVRAFSHVGPEVTLDAIAKRAGAGTVQAGVAPTDVLAGLSGVSLVAGEPEQHGQARRLLDLLMDGLRHRATT